MDNEARAIFLLAVTPMTIDELQETLGIEWVEAFNVLVKINEKRILDSHTDMSGQVKFTVVVE